MAQRAANHRSGGCAKNRRENSTNVGHTETIHLLNKFPLKLSYFRIDYQPNITFGVTVIFERRLANQDGTHNRIQLRVYVRSPLPVACV